MCKFFSFVTKGSKKYYFNWEERKALLTSNPNYYEPDSHTSICARFSLSDDKVNKYEYSPLTKVFTVDQTNIKDDQAGAKKWVDNLDFKTIIEPLIIKPIVNPLHLTAQLVQPHHVDLLKEWDSVRDSVRDSVGDSVGDGVWDGVWDSVWDSVGASVWDSVWASVWASVWDSVWAYTSSFTAIEQFKFIKHEPFVNPYQCLIDLWNDGFVPSFDGKTWRLHAGVKAEVVYKWTPNK